MKKLPALLLLISLFIPFNALGNVVEGTQKNTNLNLSYPLVYVDEPSAQSKINTDIASFVEKSKSKYNTDKNYKVSMNYEVSFEDDDVLSVILLNSFDSPQLAHPYHYMDGLVYNKHTGDRIPLYNYVIFSSETQFKDLIRNRVLSVFNEHGKQISVNPMNLNYAKMSSDYALVGNGTIVVLFAPYELTSYADGETSVVITPNNIEYINGLNN